MTTQYINRIFPIRVQRCPKKKCPFMPSIGLQRPATRDSPWNAPIYSGKCDLMQQDVHGKPPLLTGVATQNLWAYLPAKLRTLEAWGMTMCCASPCTMLPLLLDHVTPKSTSLTHNVLVKIPFAPHVWPSCKNANISVLVMYAGLLGHAFSGMACNHGRHSPVKEGWGADC